MAHRTRRTRRGVGRSWHGHHTAGSASASVGSTYYKRRARAAARDRGFGGGLPQCGGRNPALRQGGPHRPPHTGAWVTGRSWHGHHTAGSASASVGSTVYKRRARAVERDSDSNGVRARHCYLQSVSQVSRSVGTGRASFSREARQKSIPSQVRGGQVFTPLSGRASVQHPNQTRFDGGELDLVIFGAHPPTAAEIAVIQHGRIT